MFIKNHWLLELNYAIPVCDKSQAVEEWRDGSEVEEEREEVLEAVKVEKAWTSKPSAGETPLWKLWGLWGAEMGTKKIAEHTEEVAEK